MIISNERLSADPIGYAEDFMRSIGCYGASREAFMLAKALQIRLENDLKALSCFSPSASRIRRVLLSLSTALNNFDPATLRKLQW